MQSFVRPFSTIPQEAIQVDTWKTSEGEVLRSYIPLNAASSVVLTTTVSTNKQVIESAALRGLQEMLNHLDLLVIVRSQKTRYRRVLYRGLLEDNQEVSFQVCGADVGGNLTVTTSVVLNRDSTHNEPLVARRAGSILWEQSDRLLVEGAGPQMPMTIMDFREGAQGLSPQALWVIQCREIEELSEESFDEPFVEHVRVLLNSSSPKFRELESDSPLQTLHCQYMTLELADILLRLGNTDQFHVAAEKGFRNGSLGDQIIRVSRKFGLSPSAYCATPQMRRASELQKVVLHG